MSFSLRYAAPETVAAFEAKELTVGVDSAVDMWALGIMAYELLTDAPVFKRDSTKKDIQDRLSGRAPLPWEDPETKDSSLRKLRMLKRSLVKCFSRDPVERPSASDLLIAWNKLFDNIAGDKTVQVRPSCHTEPYGDSEG